MRSAYAAGIVAAVVILDVNRIFKTEISLSDLLVTFQAGSESHDHSVSIAVNAAAHLGVV